MRTQIKPALLLFLFLTLVTGVAYPALVTGIANLAFPQQANGSQINSGEQIIGSTLIGQSFSSPRYFWGRPSATAGHPYNAFDSLALTGSSGSNLGPLSQTLINTVDQRVKTLHDADPNNALPIPVDLVTASASGLDPHISLAAAEYQVARVAHLRNLSIDAIQALVTKYTENRQFGFLGEPRVNVLLLNIALDEIK
jgi:K+-transporting ATPase KdpC subunit